jgi:fructose-bisphosphate aldolase class I
VLAADESSPTIKKRFDTIKVESTEEDRRRYREILFTTAGIEKNIGGVILYDETLRQSTKDGTPFAKLLDSRGIIPGIKVDKGAALRLSAEVAGDWTACERMNTGSPVRSCRGVPDRKS